MPFTDRRDAGRRLADRLATLPLEDPVVVGLPRGGVVVAAEVARALGAPLDIVVVRKLGAPGRPELGIGAIGEDRVRALNTELVDMLGVTEPQIAAIEAEETEELARRVAAYRGGRPPLPVQGRNVVVIDDGLATGYTARAAVRVVKRRGARRVILAIPVSAPDTARALEEEADEVVALELPFGFGAVGQWYADFRQTTDGEVLELLGKFAAPREVSIELDEGRLPGVLTIPVDATGVVIFAHGSGSSRHSPRNREVADRLNRDGLATLLFDLLSNEEAADRANVFNIPLLADRLSAATRWVAAREDLAGLPVGYFGASTGAAAALWAAAGSTVAAIVGRGGRPDLAAERLEMLTAPTLLIVGEADIAVLELNRRAAESLHGEVAVIPAAGHLFEEPGALARVADLASEWFLRWFEKSA